LRPDPGWLWTLVGCDDFRRFPTLTTGEFWGIFLTCFRN